MAKGMVTFLGPLEFIGDILVACSRVSKWSIYSDFRMSGSSTYTWQITIVLNALAHGFVILRVGSMDIVQTKFWS